MNTDPTINRTWHLVRRPSGDIRAEDFELRTTPRPEPAPGQCRIRVVYLSLDPGQRLWVREKDSYAPSLPLGVPMVSFAMGVVETDGMPELPVGTIVTGVSGWQDYALVDSPGAVSIVARDPRLPLLARFGMLEHIGLTAYFGTLDLLDPKPGETMVVSGAAGAVGSLALQIGKIMGSRVVGIAGSDAKCAWLTNTLGADAAVNYRRGRLTDQLRGACPQGVDTFFDNVGGECLEAVLDHINLKARIAMCGAVSQYGNDDRPYAPSNIYNLLLKRARMEGFIVLDYAADRRWWRKAEEQMIQWHLQGRLQYRLDVVDGLEQTPVAMTRLFTGANTGKLLVRVSAEPGRA
jgi:NADPH-dependent curcumin reductase CurA